jgi:hypothetical protein
MSCAPPSPTRRAHPSPAISTGVHGAAANAAPQRAEAPALSSASPATASRTTAALDRDGADTDCAEGSVVSALAAEWRALATIFGLTLDILGAWVIVSALIRTTQTASREFSTEKALRDTAREGLRAKEGSWILTAGFFLQGTWRGPEGMVAMMSAYRGGASMARRGGYQRSSMWRGVVLAALLVGLPAGVGAEGASVSWEETELITAGNDAGREWKVISALPSDWKLCWKMADDKAKNRAGTGLLPLESEVGIRTDTVVVFHGEESDMSSQMGSIRYFCVPDAVAPRERKGSGR